MREPGKAVVAFSFVAAIGLTLVSCGGGGDEGGDSKKESRSSAPTTNGEDRPSPPAAQPPSEEPEETLAEVKGGQELDLKITRAQRDAAGFLTVSGSVTNGSGNAWTAADWRGDERELRDNGGSIAGASLVDAAAKKRYLVLRDTQGRCLCTRFVGGVNPGATTDWFAQFPAPPASTKKVTFQVGSMPPAEIPLSEAQ
ncbi:secreted protein [Streptomyces sp. SPB074]|nr:secreted protein [Streptomyces sp. SPB074]